MVINIYDDRVGDIDTATEAQQEGNTESDQLMAGNPADIGSEQTGGNELGI
jgi:hypothetical protein